MFRVHEVDCVLRKRTRLEQESVQKSNKSSLFSPTVNIYPMYSPWVVTNLYKSNGLRGPYYGSEQRKPENGIRFQYNEGIN